MTLKEKCVKVIARKILNLSDKEDIENDHKMPAHLENNEAKENNDNDADEKKPIGRSKPAAQNPLGQSQRLQGWHLRIVTVIANCRGQFEFDELFGNGTCMEIKCIMDLHFNFDALVNTQTKGKAVRQRLNFVLDC